MEVIHKNDNTKQYTCDECESQFNWNDNSWRLGSLEKKESDLYYCSDKCVLTLKD